MKLETQNAGKLDYSLAQLLDEELLGEGAKVPVIVTCQNADDVHQVVERVQGLKGTVRHTYDIFAGVSAWVPIEAVGHLAEFAPVQALELDQPADLA